METETNNSSQSRQTASLPVQEMVCLSEEEKTALLEKTLAELAYKNRELQIEGALDRVRTRTMAMHHSDEILNVITELKEQLLQLGFQVDTTNFNIGYRSKEWSLWMAPVGDLQPIRISVPYLDNPIINEINSAIDRGDDFVAGILTREEKDQFVKHLFENTSLKNAPEETKQDRLNRKGFAYSVAFSKNTAVTITNYDGVPYSDEQNTILRRFGNAFEQAFTRFLDLQRAETQEREAKLEAALERVRSRTMAMRRSGELSETAVLLFKQLVELGNEPERITIAIPDEANGMITFWVTDQEGSQVNISFQGRMNERTTLKKMYDGWKAGKKSLVIELQNAELAEWLRFCREEMGIEVKEENGIGRRVHKVGYFSHGWLNSHSWLTAAAPASAVTESVALLERFASVFNLTYQRFLDLQKAEAQAREAQIEAALERVRSASLTMHRSEELKDVITIVFEKLKELGLVFQNAGIQLFTEGSKDIVQWVASPQLLTAPVLANLPYTEKDFEESEIIWDIWTAKERGEDIYDKHYSVREKNKFFEYAARHNNLAQIPEKARAAQMQAPGYTLTLAAEKHAALWVDSYSGQTISIEGFDVLKRTAKVFEQAYVRFLDLQRAEAQAREAQIEAALERVRARAMAMHKSDELKEVAYELRRQMGLLGQKELETCAIHLYDESPDQFQSWAALKAPNSTGEIIQTQLLFPKRGIEIIDELMESYAAKKQDYVLINDPEKLQEFLELVRKCSPESYAAISETLKDKKGDEMVAYWSVSDFSGGSLIMVTYDWPDENTRALLRRFANVFALAYRRFVDLKRAEAQAREAQIEAALERVRSRTIGMQRSDELQSAAVLLFQQVVALGVPAFGCGFNIWDEDQKFATAWMGGQDRIQPPFKTSSSEDIFLRIYEAAQRGEPLFVEEQEGDALKNHYAYMNSIPLFKEIADKMAQAGQSLPTFQIMHCAFFSQGYLMFISYEPVPYAYDIFIRFTKVFEQTYTRFLDLQKAEAQAREAQIEAALEKVRARAMAMQTSEDVSSATAVLFSELHKLGIETMRCGILIIRAPYLMELWASASGSQGHITKIIGEVKMTIHELLRGVYRSWEQKKDIYYYYLTGEDRFQYYQAIAEEIPAYARLQSPEMPDHHCYVFYFEEGGLYTFSVQPHPEETKQVLKRFTAVFSLTFRRFQDLKNAEAQAREAIKASSLDRIRAEIASMRTADDLNRITPSVWKELTALGVPFFRCGVFIMNEKGQLVHVYLSTPDGKPLAVLHLPFQAAEFVSKAVDYWRLQRVYVTHWNKEQFKAWVNLLIGQGQIQTATNYQGGDTPPASLTLQLVPFAQGMLYIGSDEALTETQVDLVKALAEAFSVAYARYEDFEKLDEAKRRVESTLEELRATQTQLIQREKMASLGELTAGIAHEIQNPLNFVNNFSEVNGELVEELKEKAQRGNIADVLQLADEIKENELKITHHGRRADAIVKSMLQHSRTATGEKQPTDINVLADEYLRLSYHGMRAKDKTFTAVVETHFDENIGKTAVVPQDIGRVLLNLFNNAFYAVNEKKKALNGAFEPTVSVQTKRQENGVMVSVRDNGPGMSQKTADKIFQPFFTTKPTGEGTGLGLSLSYDIITKGHGGVMEVKTKENEGAEFIILLPHG